MLKAIVQAAEADQAAGQNLAAGETAEWKYLGRLRSEMEVRGACHCHRFRYRALQRQSIVRGGSHKWDN